MQCFKLTLEKILSRRENNVTILLNSFVYFDKLRYARKIQVSWQIRKTQGNGCSRINPFHQDQAERKIDSKSQRIREEIQRNVEVRDRAKVKESRFSAN